MEPLIKRERDELNPILNPIQFGVDADKIFLDVYHKLHERLDVNIRIGFSLEDKIRGRTMVDYLNKTYLVGGLVERELKDSFHLSNI